MQIMHHGALPDAYGRREGGGNATRHANASSIGRMGAEARKAIGRGSTRLGVLGAARDDGRRAGSGSAAHACRDEDELRIGHHLLDELAGLLRRVGAHCA